MLKEQNKSTKSGGLVLPSPPGRRGQPSTFGLGLLPLSSTDFFFPFPGLALPGGGAADGRRERPPAKRFLILHLNRFQKAPWRNANRAEMSEPRGIQLAFRRSNPFFCSGFSWGGGGGERRGAHAKRGFGEGRAVRTRPQSPTARVSIGTLFYKMQLTAADRRGLSKILISKAF